MPPYQKKRISPIFNIIVNPTATEYSEAKIKMLTEAIVSAGCRYFISEPDSRYSCIGYLKKIVNKKPNGLIVCGGDGTVNLAARQIIRRTISLGIYPLGKENNIYHSLYGKPDLHSAIAHILSRHSIKIDYGMASNFFFLGSIGIGLLPELHEVLQSKKTNPRFAIGWSRIAATASSAADIKPVSLKIDAFAFDLAPQLLNVNLLSYSSGLKLAPSSIHDDGKCEITFDAGDKQAIMSNFIRKIFKEKYLYSEEVRMFRGQNITLNNINGRKMYLDGEIIRLESDELHIEVQPSRIRVYHQGSRKK
ncbi:MAG: diacylglycerol kinase family protein [Candidatus Zixiibacteriota bacterium]